MYSTFEKYTYTGAVKTTTKVQKNYEIFFGRNANSSTTILWDECAIEESLRQFVCLAFDTSTDVLTFFDTFESGAILQTSNSLSQSQKDAALLWSSWKSLVIFLVLRKYYKYIFKDCKQTADFLKVFIFQITLMASLLSNGAQGIVSTNLKVFLHVL